MRTISPQVGRNGNDESPVRLNGCGIRNIPPCVPVGSAEGHVEPCGIDGWISEISRAWARGPENTLELASLLHQARRSMEHGQWSCLWRSQQLPFSKRKAEMLVIIGQGLGGANAQTFARLPSGWNVLYYVAQLGQELAERLIAAGRIHPRLRLREARELLAEFRPESTKKSPTPTPLMRRLARFSNFVETYATNWSRAEGELFRAEPERLFEAVPTESKTPMNNPNSHEHIKCL